MSAGPAEIIGLDQSIAYAQHLAAEAGLHGPQGNEGYLLRLQAARVTGESLTTGSAMQQAFATAAAAATAHAAELIKQTGVQEQYDANPDAGDKDYQTGNATPQQPAEPGQPAGPADDVPAAATAAPADPRPAAEPPVREPAAGGDGEKPPPPKPEAKPEAKPEPKPEPMVRVKYTIQDVATSNWLKVGSIDVAPALAYADDRILTTALAQELHRRGEMPSGSRVLVSPRHPDQPAMAWVRYAIEDGHSTVGEGSIQVNLSTAPAGDAALGAVITQHLRSQGAIAHDWRVRVLEKVN